MNERTVRNNGTEPFLANKQYLYSGPTWVWRLVRIKHGRLPGELRQRRKGVQKTRRPMVRKEVWLKRDKRKADDEGLCSVAYKHTWSSAWRFQFGCMTMAIVLNCVTRGLYNLDTNKHPMNSSATTLARRASQYPQSSSIRQLIWLVSKHNYTHLTLNEFAPMGRAARLWCSPLTDARRN